MHVFVKQGGTADKFYSSLAENSVKDFYFKRVALKTIFATGYVFTYYNGRFVNRPYGKIFFAGVGRGLAPAGTAYALVATGYAFT